MSPSQLRVSVGLAPIFPRYLWWLVPTRTDLDLVLYHALCKYRNSRALMNPGNGVGADQCVCPSKAKTQTVVLSSAAVPLVGVGSKGNDKDQVVEIVPHEYRFGQLHHAP